LRGEKCLTAFYSDEGDIPLFLRFFEGDFGVFEVLTNRQQVTFGIKVIYNPPGEERLPQKTQTEHEIR
jgi:hypothetical protein